MAGSASISGLASGLDTQGMIEKLMELEQAPVLRLQSKKATLSDRLSAWQEANTRIMAVKEKADVLARDSTFDSKTITSSNESILKATASYSAQAGTYYLKVKQIAHAHQLASDGFADTNSTKVGTGKISITVAGATKEVTIDSSNNTLMGLRDAINQAKVGVTAAIINDGKDNPYHLVITSNTTGTAGNVQVDTANLSGGTVPAFTTMQSAQNAIVLLGEGIGQVTVEKSSNSITDVVPGVTLNLQSGDETKTITVSVQPDTSGMKQNIKDFVQQYNNLIDFINRQFKYDTTTNTGGTLFSDSSLSAIQGDIVSKISNPVSGLNQSIKVLSQAGITMTSDNKLTIKDSDLDAALSTNSGDIKRLFASLGEASSPYVSFVASSELSKVPGESGYGIVVTTVATQTTMTSGSAMAASLGQDETLTINGKAVALTAGMTQDQAIAKINERSSQTGVTASLTDNGGIKYLTLTSNQYGSGRTIVVSSSVASGTDTTGVGIPQSRITAGVAQSENLNKAEKLTINGIDIDLKVGLNQDQVVAKINEFTAQTGVIASRTDKDGKNTGNFLTLSRSAAGPTQAISVVSTISNGGGTPAKNTSGIGTVAVTESSFSGENGAGTGVAGSGLGASTEGVDVAGTINGEEATGKGQILTGKSGNQTTDGLVVRIAAPTPGAYGTVRFSKGISSILTDYLDTITRPTTGSVKSAQDAIQSELSNIDKDIASMNTQLTTKQERLRIQFATMESAMSRLQNEGTFISSQLGQLSSKK